MSRTLSLRWGIVVTVAVGGAYALDSLGVFIYLSYLPLYALALALVALYLFWARRQPIGRGDALASVALAAIMAAAVIACPQIPTSRRKAFYLEATALRPGMTMREVRARMSRFVGSPFESSRDSVSFGYQSRPGTVDVVVVRFDSTSQRVVHADYSPD